MQVGFKGGGAPGLKALEEPVADFPALAVASQQTRLAFNPHADVERGIRQQGRWSGCPGFLVIAFLEFLIQQAKGHGKAIDGGLRGWRAAGNVHVNGHNLVAAAPHGIHVVEDAAAAPACAVRDAYLGVRRVMEGAQGGHAHGAGNSAREQQNIRMAGRGNHLDAETLGIKNGRDGREDFNFAAVAAAAVNAVDVGGALNALQKRSLERGYGILDADRLGFVVRDTGRVGIGNNGHGYTSCRGLRPRVCLRLHWGQVSNCRRWSGSSSVTPSACMVRASA